MSGPLARDRGRSRGLNESAHPAGDARFERDCFRRLCRAENLARADGSQAQIQEWRNAGVTLGHGACELSRGFNEQDARHQRMAGKMAAQKRFLSADGVFAAPGFAGLERGQAIDEAELRAVRQVREGIVHGVESGRGLPHSRTLARDSMGR